jgi:hypothetical protein
VRERHKRDSNWDERSQITPFADDMIIYLKDPKYSTKNLLGLINTFSSIAGYKINIQKTVAFLLKLFYFEIILYM